VRRRLTAGSRPPPLVAGYLPPGTGSLLPAARLHVTVYPVIQAHDPGTEDEMRELALVFRALADETRLQMMAMLLRHREICVCDFVEVLGVTQSKASRHLRYLLHAGLVEDRRAGLWVHYRLADKLGPDARVIARGLRSLLAGERLRDLQARLDRSMKRKAELGGKTCAAPQPRRNGRREAAR
jgi:ArsR family transcriptional regulator